MTVLWLSWQIIIQYCKFFIPRPIKRGILDASTIILSKDIDKYAFMCGSNFYVTDVSYQKIRSVFRELGMYNFERRLNALNSACGHPSSIDV